jgi:predicted ATPase
LFGRDDDIAAVADLVRSGTRLVTLTGPGGVGKTRLAAAVSEVLAGEFPDGLLQISLAPLADASALMATIGRALGLAGLDAPGAYDLVAAHLRASRLLLLLDNSSTCSAPRSRSGGSPRCARSSPCWPRAARRCG